MRERESSLFVENDMMNRNQNHRDSRAHRFGIRCLPSIQDPSEFTTILVSSLRSLFGEMECYSANVKVSKVADIRDDDYQFVVECDKQSKNAIRASLTMITTPKYLESNVYRFDAISLD